MKDISNSELLSILSIILFYNLSGFGFIKWFFANCRYNNWVDYVYELDHNSHSDWPHILIHYFISQRSSSFIITLCSTIIFLLYHEPFKIEYNLLGILIGLLPPLQHQAFFSILFYIIIYFFLKFINSEKNKHSKKILGIKKLIFYFLITSFISLIHYKQSEFRLELIRFKFYWEEYKNNGYFYSPIIIWFINIGFFIFLSLISYFILDKNQKKIYLPSIIIFFIGNFFSFHPYNRNNSFYFIPNFILISSIMILILFKKIFNYFNDEEIKGFILGILILIYFSMITSSILGFKKIINQINEIWTESDLIVSSFIIKNTNIKDIFLCPNFEFNPISSLSGRRCFLSSQNLLYTQGYAWHFYLKELEDFRKNPSSNNLLMIKYTLENSRKFIEDHLNSKERNKSWKMCYGYESYQLYNRTFF